MKDRQEGQLHGVHTVTYCTRNGSCVGSDTRIGSWRMSTYSCIQELTVFCKASMCSLLTLVTCPTMFYICLASEEQQLECVVDWATHEILQQAHRLCQQSSRCSNHIHEEVTNVDTTSWNSQAWGVVKFSHLTFVGLCGV